MKQPETWIVVADGSHARFYRLADDRSSMVEVAARLESARARGKIEDLVTDRQGRSFDSAGEGRHGLVPEVDPKAREKERFHEWIAATMRDAATNGGVERFVLVAEPQTLGALRGELVDSVRERVVAELDTDHTNTPPATILRHVKPLLPSPL